MELSVLPLHKHHEYLLQCCYLINDEWKRSETARLRSLESSCDGLPVSLVLINENKVIGHAKLSAIPSINNGCFVESVVISKTLRGQGFGSYLMQKAEEYSSRQLGMSCIYLSTKGQEEFYRKLGYCECEPISIYGGVSVPKKLIFENCVNNTRQNSNIDVPKPPPMPKTIVPDENCTKRKTFMFKTVNI